MGVGLGQAPGPQGNPALWGKERAASPGLMELGKREPTTQLWPGPSGHQSPQPPLAVHYPGRGPQKTERLGSKVITVKQQVGCLCGPRLATLTTPKMSRARGGPQIALRLHMVDKSTW